MEVYYSSEKIILDRVGNHSILSFIFFFSY
nr:MAG TPA: hypothetical protein [Myoviridae sp. ctfuG5]